MNSREPPSASDLSKRRVVLTLAAAPVLLAVWIAVMLVLLGPTG